MSENNFRTNDVEFVELVRAQPIFYDKMRADYHKNNLKGRIWDINVVSIVCGC